MEMDWLWAWWDGLGSLSTEGWVGMDWDWDLWTQWDGLGLGWIGDLWALRDGLGLGMGWGWDGVGLGIFGH